MAGGFYLVQEAPDHCQYYKLGEEIVTWTGPGDLVEKVGFYVRNPRAGEKVSEAGQRRALAEHTWQHRFDRLFEQLQLQGKLA